MGRLRSTRLHHLPREPLPARRTDERDRIHRPHRPELRRRRGGASALRARHAVGPHWKRQAYGPKHSRRRWIVIERYERGPAPDDDQIVVTRLAERQRPAGDDTSESP